MILTVDQVNTVNDVVTYHAPSQQGIESITQVREAAKVLILTMMQHCPSSADRSAAIRKVREAMMTANASIVLEGRSI